MLDTSDVPPGVVNIVTGDRDHLTLTLIQHEDVDAMWYFGTAVGSYHTEYESAANMKRTWVNYGIERDWLSPWQGRRSRIPAREHAGQEHLGADGRVESGVAQE